MGCLISKIKKNDLSDVIIDTSIFSHEFNNDDIQVDNRPRTIYDDSYINSF